MKNTSIFIAFLSFTLCISAQNNNHSVINSGGTERKSLGLYLTDNVGEPFIQTVSNGTNKVTQGFLQPAVNGKYGLKLLTAFQGPLCIDKEEDAFIALTLAPSLPTQTITYLWSPPSVCPTNDCAKVDSLRPGVYTATVIIAYRGTAGSTVLDTLKTSPITINNATSPCLIKVYKGITPNGDGMNDVLQIDNIREFPDNRVTIYNRWGQTLFDINGYDERDPSKSWPAGDARNSLVASTYFYVIELGNGHSPVKGWVELLKD